MLLVEGDATKDENLGRAGLGRARGLVTASDSDADNLYVVLSARSARLDLTIVSRASGADAERELSLAGADRIVLPYSSAGPVMANLVLKPQVTGFLDVVMSATGPDHETGAIVVTLGKSGRSFDTTPEPDTPIVVGDVPIGVGSPDEIPALEDFFAPRETLAG